MNRLAPRCSRRALMLALLVISCADRPESSMLGGGLDPFGRDAVAPDGALDLRAVTPASGPAAGGILLTLDGANFSVGATVVVGGLAATSVRVESPGRITAVLPERPGGFGRVPVVVQNPDGQRASRADLFAYRANQLRFPGQQLAATSPHLVATGDFNGDQRPDLVIASNATNQVSMLLGDGKGGFGTGASFSVELTPRALVVGDANGV